jgi:hypothetical protein
MYFVLDGSPHVELELHTSFGICCYSCCKECCFMTLNTFIYITEILRAYAFCFSNLFIHRILFCYQIYNSFIFIHHDNIIISITATNICGQSIYFPSLKAILPKYKTSKK